MGEATPPDCPVIIDSLSTLLEFHPTSHVCRLLHQIGRRCGLVVCLLHSDLHGRHVTSQVDHVMSTTIDLVVPQSPGQLKVKVKHRKTTGKVLVSTEVVAMDDSYDMTSSPQVTSSLLTPSHPVPDPTQNLTFDLTLSEREREERRKLVLPYHHSAGKKTALLQAGSGRVFYTPDEADDYDDSDPDDDLDI
ncbi:Elongator complex protein 5 [Geodia barretti]|nr:Elongator complex protein 5 [Geodia barretti]